MGISVWCMGMGRYASELFGGWIQVGVSPINVGRVLKVVVQLRVQHRTVILSHTDLTVYHATHDDCNMTPGRVSIVRHSKAWFYIPTGQVRYTGAVTIGIHCTVSSVCVLSWDNVFELGSWEVGKVVILIHPTSSRVIHLLIC